MAYGRHPSAEQPPWGRDAIDGSPVERQRAREHNGKRDEDAGVNPDIALTTWDDYAIMAMVEKGLGLAILPSLILQRVPYRLIFRPLESRAHRSLVFATKVGSDPSLAVKRFREYLL